MKRIGLYICSLLLALCACTDTAFMQDVQREIEVCLNFSTVQSGSETKASMEVTPLESTQVQNVWVMQFDGTAGSSRLLLAKYYPTFVPGTKVKLHHPQILDICVLKGSNPSRCLGCRIGPG